MKLIAFSKEGRSGFGQLVGDTIHVCSGDMFADPEPEGRTLPLESVVLDIPCRPSKLVALWNNFHAAAEKQRLERPEAPLFFIKPPNTYRASGAVIAIPEAAGRVLFEGELGIVIGKAGRDIPEADAVRHIAGYTCLNDVTAHAVLHADRSFPQWTRSKGFDGFCPFGPVVATDVDPRELTVRTLVNGRERQNYPLADMIFPPARLVSMISTGMTLEAGDVIACGTSQGAGPIPKGATVDVIIEGIGALSNRFE